MDLYYSAASPPCRAVAMTAKALGIDLNKKSIDMHGGSHLKEEFLKLNPQHTIPTLVDGDFSLWESRAIMIYLVEKYGQMDDDLYPSSPKKRALINQRLFFDMGTLYQSLSNYYHPQLRANKPAVPELYTKMEEALELFDTILNANQYAAGDTMTLADLALLATISTFEAAGFDLSKYSNIAKWYANIKKSAPGADENQAGCLETKKMFATLKS